MCGSCEHSVVEHLTAKQASVSDVGGVWLKKWRRPYAYYIQSAYVCFIN